jgi:sugar phosphate isomerase/epimerase
MVRQEAGRIAGLIQRLEMKRVSACNAGLGPGDPVEGRRRLAAVCDLAAALTVPVITIPAARQGTPIDAEVGRLHSLVAVAADAGVQLTVETHINQLTERPDVAVQLCQAVPGLGLTLDASHFYAGPNQGADYGAIFPYVRHVHLRDAGRDPAHLQVPAGSGLVDFRRLVDGLHAAGYEGKFAIEYIDTIPIVAREGEPADVAGNILRLRDLFVATEREAGIVRAPAG